MNLFHLSPDFDTLHDHIASYIESKHTSLSFPLSHDQAKTELYQVMKEIEEHLQEYHVAHDQIIFRVSYLLFCHCLVERALAMNNHLHLRGQMQHWLTNTTGLSLEAALQIAIERYTHLIYKDDAEFIDQYLLVPLAKRLLGLA